MTKNYFYTIISNVVLHETDKEDYMTKMDWLLKLRKVRELDTLEKIIDKKKYELTDAELAIFWGAADHRLAELTMNRIFDRVPADIWRFII